MKKVPTECKLPDSLTVDQFQEQLYSIFEKKGILQDVRAFLRNKMINVVRGMQSGNVTISPQRHMQRMELPNQVMNILISEYLLRRHFNYTLSMFTTEIPLIDMTFDFAKRLFSVATVSLDKTHNKYDIIHFKEHDVREILNILGFPNDSPMKADVIKIYRKEPRQPLLVCILTTLVKELTEYSDCATGSDNDVIKNSNNESTDHKCAKSVNKAPEIRWKDKYEKKIQKLNLVYSEELNLKMKKAKEKLKQDQITLKIKMQDEWKCKEERLKKEIEKVKEDCSQQVKAMEHNVNCKKKFLWQLFRSIQEQAEALKKARDNVKKEDRRVKAKIKELQSKIMEGETILSKKGEGLNHKIKREMLYLEEEVKNVERERRALSHERRGLNNLQSLLESERAALETEKKRATAELESSHRYNKQLQDHCETLKSQLDAFNRIGVSGEDRKIVIERSTQSDIPDPYQTCLNNVPEIAADKINSHPSISDSRDNMKQTVVNNLKKWKNVNMTNDLEVQTDLCGVVRSEVGLGTGETTSLVHQILEHTQEDNRNLRAFLDLQKSQIQELIAQKVSLQSELATANLTLNNLMRMKEANERILAVTPHLSCPAEAARGAGEEVGVACNSPVTSNQILVNQPEKKFKKFPATCRLQMQQSLDERHSTQPVDDSHLGSRDKIMPTKLKTKQLHCPLSTGVDDRLHERSHKSRTKQTTQDKDGKELKRQRHKMKESLAGPAEDHDRNVDTDSIVNAVRRRFRKLEIEAEAVDKAYRQFKTRYSDSTMNYGRLTGTNITTARTSVGIGEFTNLQPYTSDILSSSIYTAVQYPEHFYSPTKKSNIGEIDTFKTITRLLDEPLMNFRKMYTPDMIKSKSQLKAGSNALKDSTQAVEKNMKECAVSPIFSSVSNVGDKILLTDKQDNTSNINQTLKTNHNENLETNFPKSFESQNVIEDEVNNVSIELLPVAIENYGCYEKYIEKQRHDIETHFEGNVNFVPSSNSVIDKVNIEKYLSPKKSDIDLNRNRSCETEMLDEKKPSNDNINLIEKFDENNPEQRKCKCKKSEETIHNCVCLALQGFTPEKIDNEGNILSNGGLIVSVQSVLINDPVLIEPRTTDLRNYEINKETFNVEESIITITVEKENVEKVYQKDGISMEGNQVVKDNLNVGKSDGQDIARELKSDSMELYVDYNIEPLHLHYKEDLNKLRKEKTFHSISKYIENTNFEPVSTELVEDSQHPGDKENIVKSENIGKENDFHLKPKPTSNEVIPIKSVDNLRHLKDNEDDIYIAENVGKENAFHPKLKHAENINFQSIAKELVRDLQPPKYEENFNVLENIDKGDLKNCNSETMPTNSAVALLCPEIQDKITRSEDVEKENISNSIPKRSEDINYESETSMEIEDLAISQSETDNISETSVAKDVESVFSDISVHKASSGDSFWS